MADEKKIIIDEDWKSQVQAEKEQAAKPKPAGAASAESLRQPIRRCRLLRSSCSLRRWLPRLVALGQVPHPVTGKAQTQRNQAKFLIDTIDVLQEKTTGNLTAAEQELLDSLLHQCGDGLYPDRGSAGKLKSTPSEHTTGYDASVAANRTLALPSA